MEKKKMTASQAKSYLDGEGDACPYCNATDISGGPLEVDGGVVTQTMRCYSCDENWIDVYSLVGICQADGERVELPQAPLMCPQRPQSFYPNSELKLDTETTGRCQRQKCAWWDKDAQRCACLELAINSRRI